MDQTTLLLLGAGCAAMSSLGAGGYYLTKDGEDPVKKLMQLLGLEESTEDPPEEQKKEEAAPDAPAAQDTGAAKKDAPAPNKAAPKPSGKPAPQGTFYLKNTVGKDMCAAPDRCTNEKTCANDKALWGEVAVAGGGVMLHGGGTKLCVTSGTKDGQPVEMKLCDRRNPLQAFKRVPVAKPKVAGAYRLQSGATCLSSLETKNVPAALRGGASPACKHSMVTVACGVLDTNNKFAGQWTTVKKA